MKRVLIVDDEPDITLLFSTALEESGLKVDSFNDPLFKQELTCRVVFILIYCL
jgi:DNA-binding response OmpR family regulator